MQNSDVVFAGDIRVGGQYHFHMETQSTVAIPFEGEYVVDLHVTFIDACVEQNAVPLSFFFFFFFFSPLHQR